MNNMNEIESYAYFSSVCHQLKKLSVLLNIKGETHPRNKADSTGSWLFFIQLTKYFA